MTTQEKKQTALMQLKDELLVLLEVCETMSNNKSPDSPDQLLGSHGVGLISGIIIKVNEKLPVEKEQMGNMFKAGDKYQNDVYWGEFSENFETYYTNTYADEKV